MIIGGINMNPLIQQYRQFLKENPDKADLGYLDWLKLRSNELKKMKQIYLDDIRTPKPETGD